MIGFLSLFKTGGGIDTHYWVVPQMPSLQGTSSGLYKS